MLLEFFLITFDLHGVNTFLPPANEVWGKVIFLHLFVILFTGGACVVLGGCPWFPGDMRGCGGPVWLQGGMCGCGGHE